MYSGKGVKILVFSDCMSYGCWVPKDSSVFYTSVLERMLRQQGIDAVVENTAGSGETTTDSMKRLEKDVLTREFDILVYQYGINDTLPRGLTRSDRGKIIRSMYRIKMNEKTRLWCRTYFLNPLEYILLKLRGPKFYATRDETDDNVRKLIGIVREKYQREIPVLLVSINPVLNYRFGNNIPFVRNSNAVLKDIAADYREVYYIDTFSRFTQQDLPSLLDMDQFHLSEKGHEIMAASIAEGIREHLNHPKNTNLIMESF